MARADDAIDHFEQELIGAWRDLGRSPDRERAFLAAGSRTNWPHIVRDRITDYPGNDMPRRPGLSRAEMARLDAMIVAPGCVISIVPADRVKLVGTVLNLKAWPERRGFRWEAVWERMGGRASGATKDGLRARYETQLRRMAFAARVPNCVMVKAATAGQGTQTDVLASVVDVAADALADAIEQVRDARIKFASGLIGRVELDQALAGMASAQAAVAR